VTINDLLPLLRADLNRPLLTGETADDDDEAAQSVTGTPSDDDLEDRLLDARDAVLAIAAAQHVPGCVLRFTGTFAYPGGAGLSVRVVRLLETRVYESGLSGTYDDIDVSGTTYGATVLTPLEFIRRRGLSSGVYAKEGGRLVVPGASGACAYYAVARPAYVDRDTDLGVDGRFQRAMLLHAAAAVWRTRKDGRAVLATQDFYRAMKPYARAGWTPPALPEKEAKAA